MAAIADTTRLQAQWAFPMPIRFGAGRASELPELVAAFGLRRPLIVTDRGLAGLPHFQALLARWRPDMPAASVFTDVQENPTGATVHAGAAAFAETGADSVVAMGGGSALDAAKCIALLGSCGGDLWRFAWPEESGATERTNVPIITLPTTAGTGAEVEASAIITDERSQTKRAIINPSILPSAVIADPALTLGLPPRLTAATGMDALSHSLEAISVADYHPMADGIAAESIRLVHDWLPRAVAEPGDLEARSHMMAAALMGAVAFAKGLGAMHALSHPLGGRFGVHHGMLNAVLMPYVLDFNRPAIEPKLIRLARLLDLPGGNAGAFLAWVRALRQQIGIPDTLGALGLSADCADDIGALAAADVCAPTNPVPLDAAILATLYRQAVAGGTSSPT
jgi:alcohol dehydrogenase class IV